MKSSKFHFSIEETAVNENNKINKWRKLKELRVPESNIYITILQQD